MKASQVRRIGRVAAMAVFGAALMSGNRVEAVTIASTFTFTNAYQDTSGAIYDSAGAGRSDVTSSFSDDVAVAMGIWTNAIRCDWSLNIAMNLTNFGDANTIADAEITSFDGNGHGATAVINFNTFNGVKYFVDSTPANNAEFSMFTKSLSLGGGTVNSARFGDASVAASSNRWDLLTLTLHEVEHSLGISSGSARFLNLVGPNGGGSLRTLTISNSVSGLPNDFNIPIQTNSAHIASWGANSNFNYTVVADPGWGSGQRALPTDIDIYALCQINDCTNFQIPEPSTLVLVSIGLLTFWRCRQRSKAKRAFV
jgi:hypothetical protein